MEETKFLQDLAVVMLVGESRAALTTAKKLVKLDVEPLAREPGRHRRGVALEEGLDRLADPPLDVVLLVLDADVLAGVLGHELAEVALENTSAERDADRARLRRPHVVVETGVAAGVSFALTAEQRELRQLAREFAEKGLAGARIDVRSVSRVGRSDFGVNAATTR